jgi:two-component system phosphate regulon sensor histidine kinase PhoR
MQPTQPASSLCKVRVIALKVNLFRSIRWRIAIPYAALILLTMLGLGLFLSNFIKQMYLDNLNSRLRLEGNLVGGEMQAQVTLDPAKLDELARKFGLALNARVTIIAPDGTVIGESEEDRTQMDNHSNRPEVISALANGYGSSIRFSHTVGYEMVYTAVAFPDSRTPIAVIRLAVPLTEVNDAIGFFQNAMAGYTLLITLMAVGLALVIAGRTIRPIQRLTETVRQTAGDESYLLSPTRREKDEIAELTGAFNHMMVRLRNQYDELATEHSKLGTVLDKINDGVLIMDNEGLIQLINPTLERMFGIEQEKVIGKSTIEIIRYHQPVELGKKCQQTGVIQSESFEIGKGIYLNCIATPMEYPLEGSTLLLFQDLTQQRKLDNVRKDFISNVSHELRTPLASLKALNETLQDGALDDPTAARRFLERMETEIDAMSLMINELLELSRIESGRVPLNLNPIQPSEIIHTAMERLYLQAERSNLQLTADIPADLPLVMADASRAQQVLINLIHNAIKFTAKGGQVVVSASQSGDYVIFSVRDTGIGISADNLPRIFERFYKADRSRSTTGTGLGLAIARHLVEAHGGSIWAESEEGKGSTFHFSIPAAR